MPVAFPLPQAPGQRWFYPSDHLPVGCQLKATNSSEQFAVISWNVLNSMWMGYIDNEKDAQGLRDSAIVIFHQDQMGQHTLREHIVAEKVVDLVKRMDAANRAPIICLQECGKGQLELICRKVEKLFKNRFRFLTSDPQFNDLGVMIFDRSRFEEPSLQVTHGLYRDDSDNFVMDALFQSKTSPHQFRVIHTHIPGGEHSKGSEELGEYLSKYCQTPVATVVMGDMNQSTDKIQRSIPADFSPLPCADFTHVNTKREPADFDQIHYFNSESSHLRINAMEIGEVDPAARNQVEQIRCLQHGYIKV